MSERAGTTAKPGFRSRATAASALRFLIVGASNNAAMYGLFVLLSVLGVAAIPAATLTYALGMVISFALHRRWTFAHTGNPRSAVIRFIVANLGGYAINVAILWVFVTELRMPQIVVQLVAVAVVAAVLFVVMRAWVFRPAR